MMLLLVLPPGAGAAPVADREIQYLLEFVAASGCTFIRNGEAHDSADAADHLRMKYRRGKKYAGSAEQFIDRLASSSSWTGQSYSVDCRGSIEATGDWLHRALGEYRRENGPGQAAATGLHISPPSYCDGPAARPD